MTAFCLFISICNYKIILSDISIEITYITKAPTQNTLRFSPTISFALLNAFTLIRVIATAKIQRQNRMPYVSSHTISLAMPGSMSGSDSTEAPSILTSMVYLSVSFTVIVNFLENKFPFQRECTTKKSQRRNRFLTYPSDLSLKKLDSNRNLCYT